MIGVIILPIKNVIARSEATKPSGYVCLQISHATRKKNADCFGIDRLAMTLIIALLYRVIGRPT